MVIQVHFPVIFLFITIIKRRILFFLLWNILIKCKKKCILSDTTENYNIHIVWNFTYTKHQKRNNTNKQTQFFGKWNWLIKMPKKNYCRTPGKGFMILFLFTSQAAETVRRLEKPLIQTIAMTTYPLNDSSSTYTGYFRGPADTEIKNYRGTVDVITQDLYCFIVLWNHFCSWG